MLSIFHSLPTPEHTAGLWKAGQVKGERLQGWLRGREVGGAEAIMWFFLRDSEWDWKKFVSPFWKVEKSNRAPMVIESCQTPPASRVSILFSPSPLVSGSICSLSYSTFISRNCVFFPLSLPFLTSYGSNSCRHTGRGTNCVRHVMFQVLPKIKK